MGRSGTEACWYWWIGALLAGFCAVLAPADRAGAEQRSVDLELVLAADVSGSMDLEEAALLRQGFAGAIRDPAVIQAIRSGWLGRVAVTYVEWAGRHHQRTLVGWMEISDEASAQAFAAAIEAPPLDTEMWTSISTALAYSTASIEANGFDGLRRVIDVSGDGPNNNGGPVLEARDAAVAMGLTINGLPILNGRPGRYGFPPMPNLDLYYQDCVIGGDGAFVIVANGFDDFARAIRQKLLLEIAGLPSPLQLLRRAADPPRPPCDAGERQLRQWDTDR